MIRDPAKELKVIWSKKENDLLYYFPSKPDGHYMNGVLTSKIINYKGEEENSILEELEKRGYDITTLRISILRK